MGDMVSVWSRYGTARKVTSLCRLLGHSSMESSTGGVDEEEAGAVVLQKQQQSTSKTTGVGLMLVEAGRTGQEK